MLGGNAAQGFCLEAGDLLTDQRLQGLAFFGQFQIIYPPVLAIGSAPDKILFDQAFDNPGHGWPFQPEGVLNQLLIDGLILMVQEIDNHGKLG